VPGRRLNLSAIEASLQEVQRDFDRINASLSTPRDPLSDEVLGNLLAGYARVDDALAEGLDLFALGNSRQLLELNILVLCGPGQEARRLAASHIAATERRFYEQPGGGIRDLMHWLSVHTKDPVWRLAAGAYVRILSQPQLYLEGNHRTGALIMSYILARAGRPPFVLTVDNAKAYFDPSALVKGSKKRGIAELTRLPKLKKRFAKLLEAQSDDQYLLPASPGLAAQRETTEPDGERLAGKAVRREAS
jgi:hypothetical protein